MRILLVDDDENLMETLSERLIQQRYAVDISTNGEMAQEFLALFTYDLMVLDRMLPDTEGISFCQQLRNQGINVPILMLTAKDTNTDKIRALDAGADDYVVKPFDFDELCARIRALLRRDGASANAALTWGELRVNPDTFEVFFGEHQLHTTPKEYALLELFLRQSNRVLSLDAIIENLWSFDDPPSDDAVRTHIKGLRQKLKAGGAPKDLIETVYGLGYRLKPQEKLPVPQPNDAKELASPQSPLTAMIAKVWFEHQETMQARLASLDATVSALQAREYNEELQQVGRSQAHKLAGSLGCYGFAEGSRLAREIENLLQLDPPFDERHTARCSTLVKTLRQRLEQPSPESVTAAMIAGVPRLLLVGIAPQLEQTLTPVALNVGMQLISVPDIRQADAIINSQQPEMILLGLDEHNFDPGIAWLQHIHPVHADMPIAVITDLQDFQQRLLMVQQGVDRILPTTISAPAAITTSQQLLHATQAHYKILIVDDDEPVLQLLRTILAPWGFQLTTLANSTQLWATLDQSPPDLLILDVEMPEDNGLELCQVLRAEAQWQQLPVLFLTVHEDSQTQQQAFSVGADDFVCKSQMTAQLPNRILNRLRRSQR